MEISQMRYYIEVCKTGSMVQAAENLRISQQGISNAIRKLEDELGCDLFYRKRSGLVLTDTGLLFQAEAEEVLRHVDRIYDICQEKKTGRTLIKIAITDSVILRLPNSLQQLLINGSPEYTIKLIENYSTACANSVYENEASFAIIYGDCDPAKFNTVKLGTVKQVFIANRANPLADKDEIELKDLDGLPMSLPDNKSYPRLVVENMFRDAGLDLNVVYVCNRPRQTIELVLHNPNLVSRTIFEELKKEDLKKIKILKIKNCSLGLPLCLVSKKGRALSAKEKLFRHMIIEAFENYGGQNGQ